MAGRIIDNTIVAGYPEPGVTADEIVGLINRYGLPVGGYVSPLSKSYIANPTGAARYLANVAAGIGPASCEESVDLEAWSMPSSVLVSVASALTFLLDYPVTEADDNTYAGVEILFDGDSKIAAYGSVGQSQLDTTNQVGVHSLYEAYYVDSIPAGEAVTIHGKMLLNGTSAVIQADASGVYAVVRLKVLRVIA